MQGVQWQLVKQVQLPTSGPQTATSQLASSLEPGRHRIDAGAHCRERYKSLPNTHWRRRDHGCGTSTEPAADPRPSPVQARGDLVAGCPEYSHFPQLVEFGDQVADEIPGIALSGFGMKEDVAESLAAGFAKHMTKPVDWQELKQAIEKLTAQIPA